jgi:hypothetical protein
MANKHRRGTRGPRKLRQKSAKSPRHEFCGPSCFFYENYMTTYDSLILYPSIFYNSCLQNPCKTTQVLRLDYLSEGEVFSQELEVTSKGPNKRYSSPMIIYPHLLSFLSIPCFTGMCFSCPSFKLTFRLTKNHYKKLTSI